jgi:hypothetical protein
LFPSPAQLARRGGRKLAAGRVRPTGGLSELSSVKVFAFLFEHKETKVTKVFSFGGTESWFFCYLVFKLKNRYFPLACAKTRT